ncbi:unnamed protein product, partial [Cyprideis torosa]
VSLVDRSGGKILNWTTKRFPALKWTSHDIYVQGQETLSEFLHSALVTATRLPLGRPALTKINQLVQLLVRKIPSGSKVVLYGLKTAHAQIDWALSEASSRDHGLLLGFFLL